MQEFSNHKYLIIWCSGYHICLTHRRSQVRALVWSIFFLVFRKFWLFKFFSKIKRFHLKKLINYHFFFPKVAEIINSVYSGVILRDIPSNCLIYFERFFRFCNEPRYRDLRTLDQNSSSDEVLIKILVKFSFFNFIQIKDYLIIY